MFVVNDSGLKFGCMIGRVPPRPLTGTFLLKATLKLRPNGVAEFLPEDEQLDLDGDQNWNDDPKEGLRYASDFALFKPGADLLLAACGYPPGGRPQSTLEVSFSVGSWSKSLVVLGDRHWKEGLLGATLTEPLPFTRMPLTWSRAFGGPSFKKNPLGKGADKIVLPDGKKARLAPNVENRKSLWLSVDAPPNPSSFGPVDSSWPQRMSKVGTYGATWLKKQWPWFPEDFDWGFFNAAPPDQQWPAGRFLKGDETLSFRNLHAQIPLYECRLPGERPRWFLHTRQGNAVEFREVPLVLDTLFADMEQERIVLVWRGLTGVNTYKMKEVEEHFILREPIRTPLFPTVEDYRRHFKTRKEEILDEAEVEPVQIEPLMIPPPAPPDLSWVEPMKKEMEALRTESLDFDPATQPGWAGSRAATRRLASVPPPPPPPQTVEQITKIAQNDWKAMKAGDPHFAKGIGDPPDFSEIAADEKEIDEEISALEKESKTPEEAERPPWTRERVVEHLSQDGHFDKEDLGGLDLSGLDLSRRRFREAVLQGTNLSKSLLDESDFSRANLGGADVTGASIKGCAFAEADLTGISGAEADFSGSTLDLADLSEAKLAQGNFAQVRGEMTTFADADLTEARFDKADLQQPDFTAAGIAGARFIGAILPDAGFYEVQGAGADFSDADLSRARFTQADLTQARFVKVRAPESVWDEALLPRADFGEADLRVSNFSEAELEGTTFYLTQLSEAKLEDCRAKGAKFVQCNLFRATFEGADLTGAKLTGSNLYEAEFFRTIVEGTDFFGANLKRTKLA